MRSGLLGKRRTGRVARIASRLIWAVRCGGTPQRLALPPRTLIEPGGLAVGRLEELYVSNHAREAGEGEVLRIEPETELEPRPRETTGGPPWSARSGR